MTGVGRGTSFPLGASVHPEGVNFGVFPKHASLLELRFFEREDSPRPCRIIPLTRERREVVVDQLQLTLNQLLSRCRIDWHGVDLDRPDWGHDSRSLALCFTGSGNRFRLHAMLNAHGEPLRFQLPPASQGARASWRRWIDTALPTPEDIAPWETAQTVLEFSDLVQPRSVACLATPDDGTRLQW